MNDWSPGHWRAFPAAQQPVYADPGAVREVLSRIGGLPPLVVSGEVDRLRRLLAQAAAGHAFLLQGGDCAERFVDCERDRVVRKLKILLQMSLLLAHALRRPIVRVARLAGQYAKPRSQLEETVAGETLPVYRGDIINDLASNLEARTPDPERMMRAYLYSATTLNFVRALVEGGFSDLRHPDHWSLAFMGKAERRGAYEAVVARIHDAFDFVDSLGALNPLFLERTEFFTSHEGLLLPYEEALTVMPPRKQRYFNLGAHFLWIGDRTRQLDGAHVEYFRGLANPIGIKVGPSLAPEELAPLLEKLDPRREPGRLTLITRYGVDQVEKHLPGHLAAVRRAGHPVLWTVDPMHGNATRTLSGIKTRSFEAILAELRLNFEIHSAEGSRVGGVHFELTGDDVTECIGGAQGLEEADLGRSYETGCDPRLNYAQSLEMAFLVADLVRQSADSA